MKFLPPAVLRLSRVITFVTMLSAGLASAHAQTFKVLHEWQGLNEGSTPNGLVEGADGRLYGTTQDGGPDGNGAIFALNPDGSEFTVLRFLSGSDGGSPYAGLIEGADGRLYGTTIGSIFAINSDGSGFTVLRDVGSPYAGLMQGTDGRLYGTTPDSIFALNTDGSGFVVLHEFNNPADGSCPYASLTEGTDGRLYGTNAEGGTYGNGTLFVLNSDGSGFVVLRHLDASIDGSTPFGGLTEGGNGRLYGTTMQGGAYSEGTLFTLNPDGSDFTVLRHFRSSIDADGSRPWASLIMGADGRLYGTTSEGGDYGSGTVFAFNPDDSAFTVLHSTDDGSPFTALNEGKNGRLYGSISAGAYGGGLPPPGAVFALNPDGSDFTVLRRFDRAFDGAHPRAGLIEGADGRLYGTTTESGNGGDGTAFAVNPDGSDFSVLHLFSYHTDGRNPWAGLTEGADGRLYGTTYDGGIYGGGTLFALNTDGSEFVVLHHFHASTEGGVSLGGLTEGPDGRLYGTTAMGGAYDAGTLFAIMPDGSGFTVLRQLTSSTDGAYPRAGLTPGADGRLFGATQSGGIYNTGALFAIDSDGSDFTVLRYPIGYSDGRNPYASLTEGGDGRLYGTTQFGGAHGNGTLFALNPDGSGFTVLRHLNGSLDGGAPFGGLIEATDGRLYGTASEGGTHGYGTLFALNLDGSDFAVLHHLDGSTDGGTPYGGLTEGADGRFYGTASSGGSDDLGTIFVLSLVPEITSPLTATGQFKQPFSYTITATNNPDDFDALGLPEGLWVNNDTGLISGVPREKGGFAVTIAASNAYGTGVADLSLTIVLGPPTITRQPQDVTAMANKHASFSVTAKSTSKLSYQWLKDGLVIPGATGHKLMLHGITSDDAGSYRVVVTNSAGSVQSESAMLTVLPAHTPGNGKFGKAGVGARR